LVSSSRNCSIAALFVLLLIGTAAGRAGASGFAVYTHGAKELGMNNFVTAHSEGPGSAYHNPALIEGRVIEAGTCPVMSNKEFESRVTGKHEEADDRTFFPSHLFLNCPVNRDWTAGLSVTSPYGLGTEWGTDWEGRYLTTNAEMQTFDISPVAAHRIGEKWRIGGGPRLVLLDATLEKNVNLSPYGLADAEQAFEGDGNGLGFTIGLNYRPTEDWSIGAVYRSGVKVETSGDVKFDYPPGMPAALKAAFPETEGDTVIHLPAHGNLGVCYTGFQNFLVEVGVRWEDWSCYEKLKFEFDEAIAGNKVMVSRKDWEDAYSYGLGIKYTWSDSLAFTAGYRHEENPVPHDRLEPSIPAADKDAVSFGVQKRWGRFEVGLAYDYEWLEDREKDNALGTDVGGTANGTYESDTHIAGFSVSYTF